MQASWKQALVSFVLHWTNNIFWSTYIEYICHWMFHCLSAVMIFRSQYEVWKPSWKGLIGWRCRPTILKVCFLLLHDSWKQGILPVKVMWERKTLELEWILWAVTYVQCNKNKICSSCVIKMFLWSRQVNSKFFLKCKLKCKYFFS